MFGCTGTGGGEGKERDRNSERYSPTSCICIFVGTSSVVNSKSYLLIALTISIIIVNGSVCNI